MIFCSKDFFGGFVQRGREGMLVIPFYEFEVGDLDGSFFQFSG